MFGWNTNECGNCESYPCQCERCDANNYLDEKNEIEKEEWIKIRTIKSLKEHYDGLIKEINNSPYSEKWWKYFELKKKYINDISDTVFYIGKFKREILNEKS